MFLFLMYAQVFKVFLYLMCFDQSLTAHTTYTFEHYPDSARSEHNLHRAKSSDISATLDMDEVSFWTTLSLRIFGFPLEITIPPSLYTDSRRSLMCAMTMTHSCLLHPTSFKLVRRRLDTSLVRVNEISSFYNYKFYGTNTTF
jgi:hypothetical protein